MDWRANCPTPITYTHTGFCSLSFSPKSCCSISSRKYNLDFQEGDSSYESSREGGIWQNLSETSSVLEQGDGGENGGQGHGTSDRLNMEGEKGKLGIQNDYYVSGLSNSWMDFTFPEMDGDERGKSERGLGKGRSKLGGRVHSEFPFMHPGVQGGMWQLDI